MIPLVEKRTATIIGPLLFMFSCGLWATSVAAHSQPAAPGLIEALSRPAEGTFTALALRVEFQPDDSQFSTGDGTFSDSLFGDIDVSIDPLPHDFDYFSAHLAFLDHYVRAASGDRVRIEPILLPEVLRVSKPMASYSPIGPDSNSERELRKLASLVEEAWMNAAFMLEETAKELDPARTFLILFHAGAGRDIELVGSGANLDKTPEDLPSLYMDEETLARLLGHELTVAGFPVRHTAILPETESRLGTDPISGEPFVLELSINGLLAASFLNYLGVPDLFDTNSGESAIGPFGLMDPLGIFAYSGLLPPLPSPWTRRYLGWIEPEIIEPGEPETHFLRAHNGNLKGHVVHVPISKEEYFLVENRQRDPSGNGLDINVYRDGLIESVSFETGDETFGDLDQSGFPGGVLVGANHYDWALPGSADEDGNRYDGGILIWHVDESAIRVGLKDNTVNNIEIRRGVDVEEADGAQDIGHPPGNPFAPRLDLGTPFDFWFEGNPASAVSENGRVTSLYKNRFASDTRPSTHANNGGATYLSFENFTASAPTMGVVISRNDAGGDGISPGRTIDILPNGVFDPDPVLISFVADAFSPGIAFGCKKDAPVQQSGVLAFLESDEAPIENIGCAAPVTYRNGWVAYLKKREGEQGGWQLIYRNRPDKPPELQVNLPDLPAEAVPGSPLILSEDGGRATVVVIFETADREWIVNAGADGESAIIDSGPSGTWIGLAAPDNGPLLAFDGTGGGVTGMPHKWHWQLDDDRGLRQVVVGTDRKGAVAVTTTGPATLVLSREGKSLPTVIQHRQVSDVFTENRLSGDLGLEDLDGDGLLDVFGTSGVHVWAYSMSGAVVPGYPAELPAFTAGSPISMRTGDNEHAHLLVATEDGAVRSVGINAKPLSLAAGDTQTGSLLANAGLLYAIGASGTVRSWALSEYEPGIWPERFGNRRNANSATLDVGHEPGNEETVFVQNETYVWPNPARTGTSRLRVKMRKDCTVGIRVVDLSGALVASFEDQEIAADTIHEQDWHHNLQSGVYFGRLRASCVDGGKDDYLLRIGVIR